MPLSLAPIVPEDASAVAHIQASVFRNDPLNEVLFPGITYEQQVDGIVHQIAANATNPRIKYLKVTDTATAQIVSMSRWEFVNMPAQSGGQDKTSARPGPSSVENALQHVDAVLSSLVLSKKILYRNINQPLSAAINTRISAAMASVIQTRPLLQLCILATLPAHERRGAASLQLKWGMEVAREQGLVVWLDASPVGLGLYRKMGFRDVADVDTNLREFGGEGMYRHVCMVWERG